MSDSTSFDAIPQICAVAQKPQTIIPSMVRFALALFVMFAAVGCGHSQAPELRVLGMQEARAREVVYVQVTNPASRPMRLTKLQYRFAASGGTTVSEGELALAREVPAGAAVLVEIPLEGESDE